MQFKMMIIENTDTITRRKQMTIQLANSNCLIVIAKSVAQARSHLRGESFTLKYKFLLKFLKNISTPDS